MTDTVVTYECPIAGNEHRVIGPDTRILKVSDGGFVVACNCGPESLDEVDEPPHETVDHMVNIYGNVPTPEKWLELNDASDGWHDTTMWDSPEGCDRTNGERWAEIREKAKRMADTDNPRNLEPGDDSVRARKVECPMCGATEGQKCQRPGGHTVRKSHVDRIEAAEEVGVIDSDPSEQQEQSRLDGFSAVEG